MNITATVSPTGGTIRWIKNGITLQGLTNFALQNLTVDDIGNYQAAYTDQNGCVNVSNIIPVTGLQTDNIFGLIQIQAPVHSR